MIDNTKVPINTPEVSGEKNPARMKQQDILVGCTTDSCSYQSESVLGWELEEKTPQEMVMRRIRLCLVVLTTIM